MLDHDTYMIPPYLPSLSMLIHTSMLFLPLFQVVFVVQYFKKRPGISHSPSDAGTADTDEASAQINHCVETSDKFFLTQVNHYYYY